MTTPVLQVKKPKHKQIDICLKTQRRLSTPLRLRSLYSNLNPLILGTLLEVGLEKEDLDQSWREMLPLLPPGL